MSVSYFLCRPYISSPALIYYAPVVLDVDVFTLFKAIILYKSCVCVLVFVYMWTFVLHNSIPQIHHL